MTEVEKWYDREIKFERPGLIVTTTPGTLLLVLGLIALFVVTSVVVK